MSIFNPASPEFFSKAQPKEEPQTIPIPESEIDPDLIDQNEGVEISAWTYPCCVCGEDTPINCEPWEFDQSMHYCGGSPRCCP